MLKIFNFVNSNREICPRPRKPAFSRMEDRFAASGRDPCGPFSEKPGLHAPPHASPMRTHNVRNASRATIASYGAPLAARPSHGVLLAADRQAKARPTSRRCHVGHCVRCENIARSPPRGVFGRFRIARSASRGIASHGVPLAPHPQRTERFSRQKHIARSTSRARCASHGALFTARATHESPLTAWCRTE